MSRYQQYCLTFKPLSTASKLPDAQTIFGAICNIILYTQGQESFDKYIDSFNDMPLLIHSSMFPLKMLPMIKMNIFSVDYINKNVLLEQTKNQINYLQKMKQYKKINYVSYDVYKQYIELENFNQLQDDLIKNNKVFVKDNCLIFENEVANNQTQIQMNTHVKKTGYYLSKNDEDSNDLYYDTALYFDKESIYYIYVKTTLSIDQLKNIFKYSHYFGFGPRHSVGKNSFELLTIEPVEYINTSKHCLILSKSSLDDQFVLADSYYQIESKLHRTSKFYLNNKLCNRINLFSEGSYLKINKSKEYYGNLLTFNIENKPLYYYAIGYAF